MNKFQQIDTSIEALCADMRGYCATEQLQFNFSVHPELQVARLKDRARKVHAPKQNEELVNIILRRYTTTYADDWQREGDC